MDGWMDGWDGWMDGWMGGCNRERERGMDGWID